MARHFSLGPAPRCRKIATTILRRFRHASPFLNTPRNPPPKPTRRNQSTFFPRIRGTAVTLRRMPKSVRKKCAVSAFEFQFRASLALASSCNLALLGDVVLQRRHRGLLRFPEHRKSPPYGGLLDFMRCRFFYASSGEIASLRHRGTVAVGKRQRLQSVSSSRKKRAGGRGGGLGEGEHPLASAEGVPPPPITPKGRPQAVPVRRRRSLRASIAERRGPSLQLSFIPATGAAPFHKKSEARRNGSSCRASCPSEGEKEGTLRRVLCSSPRFMRTTSA